MAKKRRGLGSLGVDALLSASALVKPDAASPSATDLSSLPVDTIRRGKYQPRTHFSQDSLQELADSIIAQGMIQPVVVRKATDGYELIAGERRWRAAQLAGLHEVPVVIRDIPDQAAAAMSLIENIQREDLNPLEEANALSRLIEEFGLTHQEAAEAVGRSRTAVSNLLRLLELSEDVKKMLDERQLEMGHARTLLQLAGRQQIEAAHHIAGKGMSVRETERYVKNLLSKASAKTAHKPKKDPNISRFEQDLSDKLGANVDIQHGAKGKGKLVIHYSSLDELDGILEHIK